MSKDEKDNEQREKARERCLKIGSDAERELIGVADKVLAFNIGFNYGYAAKDAVSEGWRYVEDWLPEDAGWYLVTAIEQFEDARTTTSFFVNGYWNRKVIAWMPLPEPAKPKGELHNTEAV